MNKVAINDAASGKILRIAGSRYRVLLSGVDSGGKMAVIEMRVPSGSGPTPHEHKGFSETFYVASGEVVFETSAGKTVAAQGASVHIPTDGEPHRFTNESASEAILMCTVQPAGLDAFFTEADAILDGSPPNEDQKKQLSQLAEKYGQRLFAPDFFDKNKV